MSPITQRVIALVAALLGAFTILVLGGMLLGEIAPPPDVTMGLTLLGWLLASYTGGAIASRLGGREPALAFTVIITVWTVANLRNTPSPEWMWVAGIVGVLFAALGAAGESITLRGS